MWRSAALNLRSVLLRSVTGAATLGLLLQPTAVYAQQHHTEQIEFRVAAANLQNIRDARVIVIDDRGNVLGSGLTNGAGIWSIALPLHVDPRFAEARSIGTVTAIAIANGYNEQAVFEVPVSSHSVQPIILYPISSEHRNEPTISLGNIHRHDVIGMINHYAKKLNLKRQPSVANEVDYAPWSPYQN